MKCFLAVLASLLFGVVALAASPAADRDSGFTGAQNSPSLLACKSGFDYNVLCFGADPSGQSDSAQAIQRAVDQANGSPVLIPSGKYLLRSPIVIEAGDDMPGPRLEGAGQDRTILEPCFVGHRPMLANSGVIDVDGTRRNGKVYAYKFAQGGYLRGFTIDGNMARDTNPGLGCPDAQTAELDGLEISAWWLAQIEDLHIVHMGGDAINFPWRHDMRRLPGCNSPDCFASAEDEIRHVRLMYNQRWGVDAAAGIAYTYNLITESVIEGNGAGGVYEFGWQNSIVNNAIAGNGCTIQNGVCVRSKPGGAQSPQPGGGILLARFNPESSEPQDYQSSLGALIERNELDSNYGYDIWVQGGDDVQIIGNRFLNHSDNWKTGTQGNYPHCQVVLGFATAKARAVVRNAYLRNNLTRSASATGGPQDFETQMYCVDPHDVAQAMEELDTTFGPNSFNFSVLAAGGGAAGVCNQSGGRVTGCEVQVGGWYPAGSIPEVSIAGTGCSGAAAHAQMATVSGSNWASISAIDVDRAGGGCTGAVWPIFGIIPYPQVNSMQNSFRGFRPKSFENPDASYGVLTSPR